MEECAENKKTKKYLRAYIIFYILCSLILPPALTFAQQFSDPWNYDDKRGLPLGPAASVLSLKEFEFLVGEKFPQITDALLAQHGENAVVRILESYSDEYPVFIEDNKVMLPVADGVLAEQDPLIPPSLVDPAKHCKPNLFVCDDIFHPDEEKQTHDILVIAGNDVIVSGPAQTGGVSLLILSERFSAFNDSTVTTTPTHYVGSRPEDPTVTDGQTTAAGGRNGKAGGLFLLETNILDGLFLDTSGQAGEAGLPGNGAEGSVALKIQQNFSQNPFVTCSGQVVLEAGHGGDGGAAGDAGAARVHYTTVKPPKVKTGDSGVFPATYRAPILTEPVTDWQCFHSDTISCKDARCHQNPSIAICDILTEADNTQCSDGIDNDLDGFKDCADFNCTQNPFVTVCPVQATPLISLRELSFEACSDNIDNDADKLIDCADPNCKVHAICGGDNTAAFYTPRGIDESRTITCTNKLDDDLDGHTDCADFECQYNPRVDACGSERTLENCFDGKDNDNDGDIDCADSGCAHNPYVKYCEVELVDPGETVFTGDPLTFLNESTFAVCNDEVDNDGDHFVDCNDYQCKNSPRADPACGPQENSFLECTDGKDNDGDNFIDCAEPTCQFSPFFGELVCKNKAQAIHKPVTQSPYPYNGVNKRMRADFRGDAGKVGAGGPAGHMLAKSAVVTVSFEPCEFFDEPCQQKEERECSIGKDSKGGTPGAAAQSASLSVDWQSHRRLDLLRSLISPRQWVANIANANTFFKRNERETATFIYLLNSMRIRAVLSSAKLKCDTRKDSKKKTFTATFLLNTLCPTLDESTLRLGYLGTGSNFFGTAPHVLLNPRDRYEKQRTRFNLLFNVLDSNVAKWISLSNSLDLAHLATFEAQALDNEVQELIIAEAAAEKRIQAATIAFQTAQLAVKSLSTTIQGLNQKLQTLEPKIQEKYKDKELWDFVSDLGSGLLSAYGGALGKAAGEKGWDLLKNKLEKAFDAEEGKTTGMNAQDKKDLKDSVKEEDALWKFFKESAKEAAKSKGFKDKAGKALEDSFTQVFNALSGKETTKSGLDPELEKLITSQTQLQMTFQYMNALMDLKKTEVELQAAKLDIEGIRSQQLNARSLSVQIKDYLNFNAELSFFDRILLGRQAYATAIGLVDSLTRDYAAILRQAEYEFLPFSSNTGDGLIGIITGEALDFNLRNYDEMQIRLTKLDKEVSTFTGSKRFFYQRFTGNPFTPLSDSEAIHYKSLGFAVTDQIEDPQIVKLTINQGTLKEHPIFGDMRKVRVRDVRARILSSEGASFSARLVRDSFDSFLVGRPQPDTALLLDFELLQKEINVDGSVKSPLHFQSFAACVAPPPNCDLTKSSCKTSFQTDPFNDSCSVSPGLDTPNNNTFFDRSLPGQWSLVVAKDTLQELGSIAAVEFIFEVAAEDL